MRATFLLLLLLAVAASARYAAFADVVKFAAKDANPEEKEYLWKFAIICANAEHLQLCKDILLEEESPFFKIVSLATIITDSRPYFPRDNANFVEYAEAVSAIDDAMYKVARERFFYDDSGIYWRNKETLWTAAFLCAHTVRMQECQRILAGDSKDKIDVLAALVLAIL